MNVAREIPPRPIDPLHGYIRRFGDLPAWFDEISTALARALAQRALRQGVPLATADFPPA